MQSRGFHTKALLVPKPLHTCLPMLCVRDLPAGAQLVPVDQGRAPTFSLRPAPILLSALCTTEPASQGASLSPVLRHAL